MAEAAEGREVSTMNIYIGWRVERTVSEQTNATLWMPPPPGIRLSELPPPQPAHGIFAGKLRTLCQAPQEGGIGQ